MNTIQQSHQQDKAPRKLSHLEYARMVARTSGENTPAYWLTVGEVIDLLEAIEALKAQAVAIPASLPVFVEA